MNDLPKKPIKTKIIEHLYDAIAKEEYKHGEQIKETYLAEKFEISRAPIREALVELVSQGILEQVARKGVFVKDINSKDIYDTYEAKGTIEGYLASTFPLYIQNEDIEILEKFLYDMKQAKHDTKSVVLIGAQFHKYTIKYATNTILQETLKRINKKSQILFLKNWTKLYTIDEIVLRHEKIVQAIKSNDRMQIENKIKEHYFETGSKIVLLKEY